MYKRIKRGKHSGNCKGRFALLYKRRASGAEEEKKRRQLQIKRSREKELREATTEIILKRNPRRRRFNRCPM